MKALEEKIRKEGKIFSGNIVKVGSFLNHRLDVNFLMEMGEEIARLYEGTGINKIITVEASGIAMAVCVASKMNVPVVFGKKASAKNLSENVYVAEVYSFTHKKANSIAISKEFLTEEDRVLIVDDFLANGEAIRGLIDIANQAKAKVVGCAIAIEKGFQGGGDKLRSEGIRVDSLAIIDSMTDTSIKFREI